MVKKFKSFYFCNQLNKTDYQHASNYPGIRIPEVYTPWCNFSKDKYVIINSRIAKSTYSDESTLQCKRVYTSFTLTQYSKSLQQMIFFPHFISRFENESRLLGKLKYDAKHISLEKSIISFSHPHSASFQQLQVFREIPPPPKKTLGKDVFKVEHLEVVVRFQCFYFWIQNQFNQCLKKQVLGEFINSNRITLPPHPQSSWNSGDSSSCLKWQHLVFVGRWNTTGVIFPDQNCQYIQSAV